LNRSLQTVDRWAALAYEYNAIQHIK
jgi:hypothetical protein